MTRLRVAPAFAMLLAWALAMGALAVDSDGDGVDDLLDNCLDISNAGQADSDGDGCGNACDADYDQSGRVTAQDWNTHDRANPSAPANPNWNPHADHDASGTVGPGDFAIFRLLFTRIVPGPSLVVGRDPVACP